MFKYEDDELNNIYVKGVENILKPGVDRLSKKRTFNRIGYFGILMLFAPYRFIHSNNVFFINGTSQRRMKLNIPNTMCVFRGWGQSFFKSIKEDYFLVTPIKRSQRFVLLWKAIKMSIKYSEKRSLILWIDFLISLEFIKLTLPNSVIVRGHTDEYSTWFGEFSKKYGFSLELYQHGIVGTLNAITIPHRIYFSKIYAFDNYSINYFKNNYVSNSECVFAVYEFLPSTNFDILDKKNELYIGVAEQCNPSWVKSVCDILSDMNVKIIIMIHPLSKYNYKATESIIIEEKKKYSNIDYLITYNSTLAIDYYRYQSETRIIFTDESAKECFSDYNFSFANSINEIKKIILSDNKKFN